MATNGNGNKNGNNGGRRKTIDREWVFMFMFRCVCIGSVIFATCFLPWSIWVTHSVFRSNHHIDFKPHAAEPVEARDLLNRLDAIYNTIHELPPPDWRKRIEALENENERRRESYLELDRENRADHAKIMMSLEVIKLKLGIPPDDGGT